MHDRAFAQTLAALDTVAGGESTVVDEALQVIFGSMPPDFDPSALEHTGNSIWSRLGTADVLTTRLQGRQRLCIVSTFEDLSEDRRSAVAELYRTLRIGEPDPEELLRELDATRRMFQAVLDTIPVRVFWKDLRSVYQGCNRLFARDSGYDTPEELIGKTDYDMSFFEQADLYRGDDRRVMTSGRAKIDYEEPQTTPTGDRIWLQTSKIPIRDLADEVIGVLGTYTDITPRKEAEAEREALLADLEGKNSELERFTYTVSHDLKNPLVTIVVYLGLLERDLRAQHAGEPEILQAYGDSIDRIRRASATMSQLLGELLELSRVGRILRPTEPVELGSLIDEALLMCDGALREAGASIRLGDVFPVVQVDGPRIVQVFQNLVDNACKYRDPDRSLVLRITAQADGAIRFEDNGIGIPERFRKRIFRLFEKLDPDTEGSGIGLALVQRILESHGGAIRVARPERGDGTVFHFGLPLADDPESSQG